VWRAARLQHSCKSSGGMRSPEKPSDSGARDAGAAMPEPVNIGKVVTAYFSNQCCCMRSANKNRAQEQEMLAQANQQRKEVSATTNMGAHVPVSPPVLTLPL